MDQVLLAFAAGCGLYDPRVAKVVMVAMGSAPVVRAFLDEEVVQTEVLEHVSRVVVVHIVFEEPQGGSFVSVGFGRLLSAEAGSAKEIVADAIVSGAGKAVDFSDFNFRFRGDAGVDERGENGDDDGEDEEHCGELTYEWLGIRKVIGSCSILPFL